jgi:GT2 family glycosyltransferase
MKHTCAVIIPNWNGKDVTPTCLESLRHQTMEHQVIVVDNGSVDGSPDIIEQDFPDAELIRLPKNTGFAGGVNIGIKRSMELGVEFVALLNDDAKVENDWLEKLVDTLRDNPKVGITTGKFLNWTGDTIDTTGDQYTTWGLPYPRGRGEKTSDDYDQLTDIFAATGGASAYRISMLKQIGLFDEDFFAYYEDIDISFRAQLTGWKVKYVPEAIAYHHIGATSGKIKGFTTYQTMKNLPLLFWKNVPHGLIIKIHSRLKFVYLSFWLSAVRRGQGWPATKGFLRMLTLFPKKLIERHHIQKSRTVSVEYIKSMLTWDLPPNAAKLRSLRRKWWKLRGRKTA